MVARRLEADPAAHRRRPLRPQPRRPLRGLQHHLEPLRALPPDLRNLGSARGRLYRCPQPLRTKLQRRPLRSKERIPTRPARLGRRPSGGSHSPGQRQNRAPLRHLPRTSRHPARSPLLASFHPPREQRPHHRLRWAKLRNLRGPPQSSESPPKVRHPPPPSPSPLLGSRTSSKGRLAPVLAAFSL